VARGLKPLFPVRFRDVARWIAASIAKLPELLRGRPRDSAGSKKQLLLQSSSAKHSLWVHF